jgi:leucyl-tRNA synthetase
VWILTQEYMDSDKKGNSSDELMKITHQAIYKVTNDLQEMNFNTAIAALMESTNQLYKIKAEKSFADNSWEFTLKTLLQLLAPFAPHIAEELWRQLGMKESIHTSKWPKHDEKYLVQDEITIVVQVNGKVRANITMPNDASEEKIVEAAKADSKVEEYLNKKEVRKTIYVPQKLVNFVV